MLRSMPPGEDPLKGTRAVPVPFNSAGTPPGEDGSIVVPDYDELENAAQADAEFPDDADNPNQSGSIDYLGLVQQAESQAMLYVEQANRRAWSDSLRAFHNEHFIGSKYTKPEWRGRSKLFVPKTRGAVRKDNAAVAASLFNSIDAINCLPGNESDPKQRAAAAVMEELVNYRTDRTSGKASFPWFLVSIGARQDALLTGVCLSKQCWKQEYRNAGREKALVKGGDGVYEIIERDVYKLDVDRPDMLLIPPENFVIDPAADWTNPAQTASYIILKWPMQIEEIRDKQRSPVNPWKDVPEDMLRSSLESGSYDTAAIRRAREFGLDRLDETQTGTHFQVVWVYENFIRVNGEDYTFYSIGSKCYLTDPKPTREVYPEQYGERPLALGYGSLEAHRIYPMSPVESWQPLQLETNDLRNLMLDATKQNVMPVTKVRRGRQIDLDQVKRRSSGSSILVQDGDDVIFETPPQLPATAVQMSRELDLELDDLAGQQNYGSVETNNALGKTLGGLKLAAGAANALQEFDIRVWIETWATPALAQIVRLEQYYESDAVVLGLCAERAQLFERHGIDRIDDDLLEQEVTVRVSVGLGAGDPQQRLAKFESAASVVAPLLANTKEFQSGQVEIDWEAVAAEVFGAVGYRDGGMRFFRRNPNPPQDPLGDLKQRLLQSQIAKNEQTGRASVMSGLASLAKVALGKRELEAEVVDMLLQHQLGARKLGFEHGARHNDQVLSALDHGHRHGMGINAHRHKLMETARAHARETAAAQAEQAVGGDAGMADEAAPSAAAAAQPPAAAPVSPPPAADALKQLLQNGEIEFVRGPDNRISGMRLKPQ